MLFVVNHQTKKILWMMNNKVLLRSIYLDHWTRASDIDMRDYFSLSSLSILLLFILKSHLWLNMWIAMCSHNKYIMFFDNTFLQNLCRICWLRVVLEFLKWILRNSHIYFINSQIFVNRYNLSLNFNRYNLSLNFNRFNLSSNFNRLNLNLNFKR